MVKHWANAIRNRRAQFQRLSDCHIFHGWLQELHGRNFSIRSTPATPLREGDRFLFEVAASKQIVAFEAVLVNAADFHLLAEADSKEERDMRRRILSAADLEFDFLVTSPFQGRESVESARLAIQGAHGVFVVEGAERELTVLDFSERGCAVLVGEPCPAGTVGTVKLVTTRGPISFDAEVRYSRPDPHLEAFYRLGMQIVDMDRLDRARWRLLSAA